MRRDIIALELDERAPPATLDKWFVECVMKFVTAARGPHHHATLPSGPAGIDESVRRAVMATATAIEPKSAERRSALYWSLLLTIRQHHKRHAEETT